jgi:aldehyde dehydrogenase (NAD+)
MKTTTRHYIDGAFVDSHGREVMDIVNPTNRKTIARATLRDEEDTRRAIAAARFSRPAPSSSDRNEAPIRTAILRHVSRLLLGNE